jgi:hypothetical protein
MHEVSASNTVSIRGLVGAVTGEYEVVRLLDVS